MSCHNRQLLLTHKNGIASSTTAALCAAVVVPVFCSCMLAAGGIRIPPQRLVLAQHDIDRETEFIVSEQSVDDYLTF